MSYIRCLSNPEGLYIWGDVDGNTYVSKGADPLLSIPNGLWKKFLKKWHRHYENDVELEGLKIREILPSDRGEHAKSKRRWPNQFNV
jgi:hypothetical protein